MCWPGPPRATRSVLRLFKAMWAKRDLEFGKRCKSKNNSRTHAQQRVPIMCDRLKTAKSSDICSHEKQKKAHTEPTRIENGIIGFPAISIRCWYIFQQSTNLSSHTPAIYFWSAYFPTRGYVGFHVVQSGDFLA